MQHILYIATLFGYFGLLITLIIWPTLINTQSNIPVAIKLLILVVPLLLPLHGLLKGNSYTFAWSHFMALFYFILAVVILWEGTTPLYGSLLLVFSMSWFLGAIFYVRAISKNTKAA